MAKKFKIAYEKHPVSPARKAELRAQGYRILDAKFDPRTKFDKVEPEPVKQEPEPTKPEAKPAAATAPIVPPKSVTKSKE